MRTSSHFPTDLLTFTEEILNVKIQFWGENYPIGPWPTKNIIQCI